MPAQYHVDTDVVEMAFIGETTPDEVIQTFLTALDDATTPPTFFLLVDVRKSTSLARRATTEIIQVAEYLGNHKDRVRRCAVIASENIHFGLSRLGAVYSETAGVMTSVFRNRDEALAWLRGGSE